MKKKNGSFQRIIIQRLILVYLNNEINRYLTQIVLYRLKNNERSSLSSPILHSSVNTSHWVLQNTRYWPYDANYSSSGNSSRRILIHKPSFKPRLSFFIDPSSPFSTGIKIKRSNQRNWVIREYRETIQQIHLVRSLVIRNLPFACWR